MLITRTSLATGITRTMDLPVNEQQLIIYATTSALVQDVFPQLSDDEREFLVSGMTKEEWDEIHEDWDSAFDQPSEFDDLPF